MVLAPGLELDAAGDVDRVGMGDRDRGGDVVGPQAAGEDRRHLGAVAAQQLPVEALAGPAPQPLAAAVEEVEVGPEGLGGVDVGGAGDVDRLRHLEPGPPRTSAQKEAPSAPFSCTIVSPSSSTARATSSRVGIDEHPDHLALAPESGGDLSRDRRIDVPRTAMEVDQPDQPKRRAARPRPRRPNW